MSVFLRRRRPSQQLACALAFHRLQGQARRRSDLTFAERSVETTSADWLAMPPPGAMRLLED
jgi:hypothetical protein